VLSLGAPLCATLTAAHPTNQPPPRHHTTQPHINHATEGNLHGILVGRENFPDGVLYASRETHYSVFKAARMYRMDAEKV
jgi:hypothetical protein